MVRIERPVIVTYARVIAPDDEVRATEILAQDSVQQRLARTRVAHFYRIAGLDDGAVYEIVLDELVYRPDPDFRRNIARLQRADHLVNENAVTNLDGDFGQLLFTAVHRIARLERRHL